MTTKPGRQLDHVISQNSPFGTLRCVDPMKIFRDSQGVINISVVKPERARSFKSSTELRRGNDSTQSSIRQIFSKSTFERYAKRCKALVDAGKQRAASKAKQELTVLQDRVKHNVKENAQGLKNTLTNNSEYMKKEAFTKLKSLGEKTVNFSKKESSHAKEWIQTKSSTSAKICKEKLQSIVPNFDVKAKYRRVRNRIIFFSLSAFGIYTFAANAPNAIAKYEVEKLRIKQETTKEKSSAP